MEMEMEMIYYWCAALGYCGIGVVIWWAWSIFNWVWLKPRKLERRLRNQGLAGNSYRLLFGDMKDNSKMTQQAESASMAISDDDIGPRVQPFLHNSIIVTHGKNSFMWLGPRPRVNIMDPELIKEVLSNHFHYKKPRKNPLLKLLFTGLLNLEGEQWAKRRKIINPAFHMEKLKDMLPAFDLSCSEMISKLEKMVSAEGSREVDVWPYLETLTSDAISRTAFGSNYEEGRRIFQLQREQIENTIKAVTSVYIPGWRFMPTKQNRRMKAIDKEVKASLRSMIEKRMEAMKAGEVRNEDLLEKLLKSNQKEIKENNNNNNNGNSKKVVGMSIPEVIEECKLFYFAGQETTAVLLLWTMVLLSRHQNWQQRAREEVLQVFGSAKPNFDGLNHLKIVTMILYEVLRLYPPVTMITRSVNEDTKLGRMSLPAGVLVCLPILFIHHDHEIWGEDAKEFNPNRFSEGLAKATKNQVSFFPFGWGPRVCIGQNLAMLEAKMALAMILQRFSFQLSPTYAHAPFFSLTLQPQYGAHLLLHKL